jgi:NADPH-dependent curcumin reductase CurA
VQLVREAHEYIKLFDQLNIDLALTDDCLMTETLNSQWLIAKYPKAIPRASDFRWFEAPLPILRDGDVRVRNLLLSLDPTNRLWISGEETYLPAQHIGDVVRGGAIGIVEESRNTRLKVGDLVSGLLGWQLYYSGAARGLVQLPRIEGVPLLAYHGVLGAVGLTAYFGLLEIGCPQAGESVLVSAAAGAVGSLVGQIAKIKGCEVVGLAGSDDKCRWLTEELHFDAAINYRTANLNRALRESCRKGVDVYFDNVGGEILNAALGCINRKGRVVTCGLISQYNAELPVHNLSNLSRFLIQRARMEAFIVVDYLPRAAEALRQLADWLLEGRLKYRVDLVQGLEHAPQTLNKLFDGSNQGKLVVQVSPAP